MQVTLEIFLEVLCSEEAKLRYGGIAIMDDDHDVEALGVLFFLRAALAGFFSD